VCRYMRNPVVEGALLDAPKRLFGNGAREYTYTEIYGKLSQLINQATDRQETLISRMIREQR
jgi:hypothetical protein